MSRSIASWMIWKAIISQRTKEKR